MIDSILQNHNISFSGDVISILKVFYGRRDQTLCAAHPSEIPDKNCRSNPIAQVQTR